MPLFVAIIAFFMGWGYLLDGEKSMCQARAKYIAEQIPAALDILSARYPFQVGIIRQLLNSDGTLDQSIVQAVQAKMSAMTDEPLVCARDDVAMRLNTDRVRVELASAMAKQIGLQ